MAAQDLFLGRLFQAGAAPARTEDLAKPDCSLASLVLRHMRADAVTAQDLRDLAAAVCRSCIHRALQAIPGLGALPGMERPPEQQREAPAARSRQLAAVVLRRVYRVAADAGGPAFDVVPAEEEDRACSLYDALHPPQQAQEIVPNLLLGPLGLACSLDYLCHLKVDYCVSILSRPSEFGAVAKGLEAKVLFTASDSADSEEDMRAILPGAVEQVGAFIAAGARVLLHCESGAGRSAAVAVAYLVSAHHLRVDEACAVVRAARPCVELDDGHLRALRDHEAGVLSASAGIEEQAEDDDIAYQLASQWQWAGVTVEQAQQVLKAAGGDVKVAESRLREAAESPREYGQ